MEKKYCTSCNNELIQTLKFCPLCGNDLFSTLPIQNQNGSNNFTSQNTNIPNFNISSSKPIIQFPWRRFFAKHIDIISISIFFGFGVGALFPDFVRSYGKNFINILSIIFFVPFEAFCLYAFGNTLGKALYGINLNYEQSTSPNFFDFLLRSFRCWIFGLGLSLPIITLFTLFNSYSTLKASNTTSWDKEGGWTVHHEILGIGRWVIVCICWLCIVLIYILLMSIKL